MYYLATEIIKKWEGFRSTAYLCPSNVWTIGWGNTRYVNGKKVQKGDKITEQEAQQLLDYFVTAFAQGLKKQLKVELNQNQFNALLSFVYNIGMGAFSKSTMLKLINEGKIEEASKQFAVWNKDNGVISNGLINRRKDEEALFNTPFGH
jgi:lysozyme